MPCPAHLSTCRARLTKVYVNVSEQGSVQASSGSSMEPAATTPRCPRPARVSPPRGCRWPPIELILTSGLIKIRERDLPKRGVFLAKPYSTAALAGFDDGP